MEKINIKTILDSKKQKNQIAKKQKNQIAKKTKKLDSKKQKNIYFIQH